MTVPMVDQAMTTVLTMLDCKQHSRSTTVVSFHMAGLQSLHLPTARVALPLHRLQRPALKPKLLRLAQR